MNSSLLNFLNMGGPELGLVAIIGLLTLYCIFDIFKSQFKDPNNKMLFLLLVVVAPVVGSLAYLLFRRNSKVPTSGKDDKMPL